MSPLSDSLPTFVPSGSLWVSRHTRCAEGRTHLPSPSQGGPGPGEELCRPVGGRALARTSRWITGGRCTCVRFLATVAVLDPRATNEAPRRQALWDLVRVQHAESLEVRSHRSRLLDFPKGFSRRHRTRGPYSCCRPFLLLMFSLVLGIFRLCLPVGTFSLGHRVPLDYFLNFSSFVVGTFVGGIRNYGLYDSLYRLPVLIKGYFFPSSLSFPFPFLYTYRYSLKNFPLLLCLSLFTYQETSLPLPRRTKS